jgi:hypothetical protein
MFKSKIVKFSENILINFFGGDGKANPGIEKDSKGMLKPLPKAFTTASF